MGRDPHPETSRFMFRGTLAIGGATFREGIRAKVTWLLIAVSLALILVSREFNLFTLGEQKLSLLREVGLGTIRICGLLLVCFLACGGVAREVERHTLLAICARPIERWEYIIGKFVGLSGLLLLATLILGLELLGLLRWEGLPVDPTLLLALALEALQALILLSLALVLAPHMRFVGATTTLLLLFSAGHLSNWVLARLGTTGAAPAFSRIWHGLLPNLQSFDLSAALTAGSPIPVDVFLLTVGYGLTYIVLALAVAVLLFVLKELH